MKRTWRKCGDFGWKTRDGNPCGMDIGRRAKGCAWHTRTKRQKTALARKGGYASRLLQKPVLPASTPMPQMDDPDAVVAELVNTIAAVRTGKLDRDLAAVVITGIATALKVPGSAMLKKLEAPQLGVGAVRVLLSSESESGCRYCLCTRCTAKFAGWSEQREIKPTVVSGAPDGDYDRRPLPEPVTTLVPEPSAPRLVYANGQPARKNMAYRRATA